MSRRSVSARIAMGIELRQIRIRLAAFGQPTIELEGTITSGSRRAADASSVTIKTLHLTPEAEAFIEAMRDAFSEKSTAKVQQA
jgi:hypothetical protein